MKEAMLYHEIEGDRVQCVLCAHRCRIAEGQFGVCQVRENQEGTLYTLTYGQLIAQNVDPIEKKPLFHFFPGSNALSIATVGCNFRCTFCQNADIAQMPRDQNRIEGRNTPPETIVETANRYRCQSIAYTYTEPTMFFEYTYDIGRLAHEQGIANVYVSNGYMTPEMLDLVTSESEPPLIDAANVDLKAFRDEYYREQCGATLQPVLDSLKIMKARDVWVEVTTLIVPGLNDSDEELRDIARFVADELGVDTPWHISRFHPTYRLTDRPSTPADTLHRARDIGYEEGLRYVYEGNLPGQGGEDTICPGCGEVAIQRRGFAVMETYIEDGRCTRCDAEIDGVGL
jgi:pyruvate formate lyase activating enzyme